MSTRRPNIPRLIDGVDPRSLPLTPIEGFVMSRIDGAATVQDLADLTSLDPDDVRAVVDKLVELGVAQWADGAISLPRASMRPAAPPDASHSRGAPVARGPVERRNVTESPAPSATREPSIVPPPRRASAPYLQAAAPTDEIDPSRVDFARSAPHAGGMTARVQLRSSAGSLVSPPPSGAAAARGLAPHEKDAFGNAPTVPPPAMGAPSVLGAPPPHGSPEPDGAAAPSASVPPSTSPSAGGEFDLTPERRRRIDDLYPVLELMDHYHVLELAPSADLKEIRARYFELSKIFHPDTAFRKNLGPYKGKMEAIFTRLTEAYDVLGRKKSRAEYDAYLELQGDARAAEAALRPSATTPPPIARVVRPSPPPVAPSPPPAASPVVSSPPPAAPITPSASPSSPSPPSASSSTPRATLSEEGRRRARELLEKRLGGGRGSVSRMPAAPASAPTPPRGRDEIVRDLAGTLKSAASHTGGLDPVQRHLIEARRKEQAGDLAAASRELRSAVSLAPDRPDVSSEQQRVSGALAAQLADKYEKAAIYEERHKKWAAAALSWSKVVEGRPDDPDAVLRAAVALVEANGDLHRAQKLAQRAIELRPDSVGPRVALGRVFIAAGLHLNARRELERAALLDPGDQIVKNLLRDLKG